MDRISLLVKPVSGLCNMECRYCFYKDELAHSEKVKPGIMSERVMETLVERICREEPSWIQVAFQGGEPTLAGLDFFRHFTGEVERRKKTGCQVCYTIQTNGLLIDEKWAEFLRKRQFLVGLSFDGTPYIHDGNRIDRRGEGTAERVEETWRMLRKHQVETNLLCVVTKQAARKAEAVYRYLKEMGARYLQFIPCISPIEEAEHPQPWLLNAGDYGKFLKSVFDLWYRDWKEGNYVSIRQMDDYVNLMVGRAPSSCAAWGRCGGYLVVESDGSIYPCDFFVEDGWYLGNIQDDSLHSLLGSRKMAAFTGEKHQGQECAQCRYFGLCRGGCKNDYAHKSGNIYCRAYKEFFPYALPRLEEIAQQERLYKFS